MKVKVDIVAEIKYVEGENIISGKISQYKTSVGNLCRFFVGVVRWGRGKNNRVLLRHTAKPFLP